MLKIVALSLLALSVSAAAQGPPPAVRSPEVHADRRVTFRLRAPAAARVELVGEVVPPYGGDAGMLNFTHFTRDLLDQIMPFVERSYRVYADPAHRAIGGLSMGAFQSIAIGLAHPEQVEHSRARLPLPLSSPRWQ